MELDLFDVGMIAVMLIALGITAIVMAWPLEGERGEVWRIIRARCRR
jgi:hypothetical protein